LPISGKGCVLSCFKALGVAGIGLIFTRSQEGTQLGGWPKLAKQMEYSVPWDVMLGAE